MYLRMYLYVKHNHYFFEQLTRYCQNNFLLRKHEVQKIHFMFSRKQLRSNKSLGLKKCSATRKIMCYL